MERDVQLNNVSYNLLQYGKKIHLTHSLALNVCVPGSDQ